jgi:hypothetical protein
LPGGATSRRDCGSASGCSSRSSRFRLRLWWQ